jgi:hypothetical protein
MAGFTFRLEHEDGMPPDRLCCTPPRRSGAVGDTIPLGRDRTLRVVDIRADPDREPVLVVEPA